jgi:hypothetical protein
MRFVGALSILALCSGSAAFGQDATDKDPQIQDLQRQIDGLRAQLDSMKSSQAKESPALDGTVRESPVDPAAEPRRLNISAPGTEGIDLTGGIGIRADYWGNYNSGTGSNDILSVGQEAWLSARAKVSEKTSVGLTLHYAGVWGNNTFNGLDTNVPGRLTGSGTGTSTANTPNVSVTEAWLNMTDINSTGIGLTAGRQRIQFGAERMIGDDEWRLNRTVFDGFKVDKDLGNELGAWSLIAVRLADSDNANSFELQPGDATGNIVDNSDLFGLYYTIKRNEIGTVDAYVFQLEDMNYNNGTANGRTRLTTYGARWLSNNFGGATIDAEGATQFGEFNGNDFHNWGFGTYMLHLGANWSPQDKVDYFRAVHAAYDYATGGSGPTDDFIRLYPSLHGTFGITDFFSWTNISAFMVGTDFDVLDGVVALSYHWMHSAAHNGGFAGYNNAGGGPGVRADTDLGQEFDATYMVDCTKSTKVGMGLGYFFPGTGYHQMTGAANDMVFAYAGVRVTF